MLSPNDLEYIADDILEVYSKLNERIIEDIARRLVNAGTMTESARWQIQIAQETGLLYDNIMEMVSDNMGTSEDVVRQIFEDAAIESLEFDDKIYKKAGLNPIPLYQSATMLNILRAGLSKTNGLINNLCMTTASSGQDAFIQASDNAYMDVVTGAFDYNTAIFNAVEKLSDEGLYVTYPSGYKNRIDVAIRRNVVTGVAQTTGEMQLERAKEMNTDLMEISAHEGARPTHSIWQGKIVSLSGKKGYLSLNDIGYGTVTGFKGANCRHDWYPFIEGISERAYTEKELKELNNQTVRYNGEDIKIYDARQMQRGLERSIREDKRKIAGLNGILTSNTDQLELLEEAKTKFALKSVELKQKEKILEDFSEQTGLKRDRARERVNKFNKSVSQKTVWSNKNSTKIENDGTILTDIEKNQITEYTRFDATRINKAIRLNRVDNNIQSKIDILDSAIKKAKPIQEDWNLHRGTIIQSFSGFENINKVSHNQIMDLEEQIIVDKAFISTSKLKAEEQGRNIIMDIRVPKGFKGALDIEEYATEKYKYQKEVLLKRNTRFYVKSIKYNQDNKKYYFDVEVIDE